MSWGGLLNGLWAASLSGAVIVLAVLPMRAVFQSRTPRWLFSLLWDTALARLLILTALPSPVSVWQWLPKAPETPSAEAGHVAVPGTAAPFTEIITEGTAVIPDSTVVPSVMPLDRNTLLAAVWLTVMLALASWFLLSHLHGRQCYADSLPCGDTFVRDWLTARLLHRNIQVRSSDRIAAPLTYGVLHPVILLPSGANRMERAALSCILEHEYQHIRRFDTLRKALLATALCLHWFNPLAWVLYVLSNRDMELACDEAAVTHGANRTEYARTLLDMEEQRGGWGLSGSHFNQNALEERIRCIMKHKKTSIPALAAVLAATGFATTVLASAAPGGNVKISSGQESNVKASSGLADNAETSFGLAGNAETSFGLAGNAETSSGQDAPIAGYVHNHIQSVENDVMILSQDGEDGEKKYSVDGGRTWLSEEDYRAQYGGTDLQVEWWTAGEYAAWLEEEKQALQSIIGEHGYTGGEGWFTWDQKRVDEAVALYESILADIKNGALYSKTVTDKKGKAVEDIALGSGTMESAEIFTFDEKDALAPEPVDEAALLEELKAFGVGGEDGALTYNGKLILHLVDGAPLGDSGYSFRYVYTNPEGVLDVHTLRSVIHNPDGSYDPMGELTGVAAEGENGFDQNLMDSATFSDSIQAETETMDIEEDIGSSLEPYRAFGLNYKFEWNQDGEEQLRMSWNGKPVHSLWDTETKTWFANNMHGSEYGGNGLDLETIYQDGKLCGLQESRTPHGTAHSDGIQQTTAQGNGGESGTTFEEIFARYQSYGLIYSPRESGLGSLTWNGQTVKSFGDLKPDGGAFSYQDPYVENGLSVYTQYDAEGNLTGLHAE